MYFRFCGLRHVALNVYEFHSPARSLSGNLQRGLVKCSTDPHREHTPDHFGVYERTNEYFIHQHSKTVKSRTVSTGQKVSKALTTALKDTLMKKRAALKQNVKNDTCIEFRRDIKALTLLADTTSSGNLFHSWTTRTEKKF